MESYPATVAGVLEQQFLWEVGADFSLQPMAWFTLQVPDADNPILSPACKNACMRVPGYLAENRAASGLFMPA